MAEQIFFFYGTDEYLVGQNARAQVDKICPAAEQALSLEIIEGGAGKIDEAVSALGRCLSSLRTVGFFGGLKVVWLRDATFFSNSIIMKNEAVKRLLGELTADMKKGLASDQFLVLTAPGIDKRSAFFKAIKEVGTLSEYNIPERDYEARPAALRKVIDAFRHEGLAIDPVAADLFVEKIGFDTRQIMSEVEKMVLYKGGDQKIEVADVQAITSSASEAITWDFTDAVAVGNLPDTLRLFRQLLFQKQTSIGLIIQVESLFQNMLNFREYMDAGWLRLDGNRAQWLSDPEVDAYFSEGVDDPRKMHWFRAGKLAANAARYSARNLAARKQLVVDTHERMVSEGSIPHELLFETLLTRLCAPRRRLRG